MASSHPFILPADGRGAGATERYNEVLDPVHMNETTGPAETVEFELDSGSATKRPEQLYNLLDRMVRQEFPEIVDIVQVVHAAGESKVRLDNLEALDEAVAKEVAHRARGIFNDFVTSPWY